VRLVTQPQRATIKDNVLPAIIQMAGSKFISITETTIPTAWAAMHLLADILRGNVQIVTIRLIGVRLILTMMVIQIVQAAIRHLMVIGRVNAVTATIVPVIGGTLPSTTVAIRIAILATAMIALPDIHEGDAATATQQIRGLFR
jgi:hypothetical protein